MNFSGLTQTLMFIAGLIGPVQTQDYDSEKYKLYEPEDTVQTEVVQEDTTTIKPQEKIAVAVMELDANGVTEAEGKALSDRLRIETFKAGVFFVMERDKMTKILDEMEFQLSGCTSDECVVEVGRIVGVKKMIAGSVSKVGEIYSVSIRLIDVETSKIEGTAIEDIEGTLGMVLTQAVPSVARQISGLERPKMNLPVKKTAFNVSTQPFDADIYMDGVYYGRSPITIEAKPEITHRLTAMTDGYEKWERYYDIKAGQQIEVNVVLSKKVEEPTAAAPIEYRRKRSYNQGFKVRYVEMRIAGELNRQVSRFNDKLQSGELSIPNLGQTVYFDNNVEKFAGFELYNLRQLGDWLGFDFGLGFYRSDFDKWIRQPDKENDALHLVFWAPAMTFNLRMAPIRYPLFYPYANFGLGYNLLIVNARMEGKSYGEATFQNWGVIYGVGFEIRPFKFIGLAIEWNHRVLNYELMDIDNTFINRFDDAGITQMNLTGNNIGMSLNLYY